MNRLCGNCKRYQDGKSILGRLWRGSICTSPEKEPHNLIRMYTDKPATGTCWTPIRTEATLWD